MARPGNPRRNHSSNRRQGAPQPRRGQADGRHGGDSGGPVPSVWLYGRHAVLSALANPRRRVSRVLATATFAERHADALGKQAPPQIVEREVLDDLLGSDAVHQGVAAFARPLAPLSVEDLLAGTAAAEKSVLLVLDEITDPRNVGAILRSAAAFGVSGLIVTRHNAAMETGALAKAASGALDQVPIAEAPNLRRTLDQLKEAGFWCLGLDHPAPTAMGREPPPAKTAWVLGAEGKGLRQLTAKNCDSLVDIPITAAMESLNVSNAAAIALYEWARHHR